MAKVEDLVESITCRGRHQALTDYATEHAGTDSDLDEAFEAASVEHLLSDAFPNGRATAP